MPATILVNSVNSQPVQRQLGLRLLKLREQRGYSQLALAKALGLSASYLNQIERNKRPLTPAVQGK
ncbi:XRE family transcriptional regulator, partial [Mycobacterium tuberculosis]